MSRPVLSYRGARLQSEAGLWQRALTFCGSEDDLKCDCYILGTCCHGWPKTGVQACAAQALDSLVFVCVLWIRLGDRWVKLPIKGMKD